MEEMKDQNGRDNYIKPYAIVKLGEDVARIIATGYNSTSAEEKLTAVVHIATISSDELKEGAKVKFIGDIMTRPKRERLAIAHKLFLLLDEPKEEDTNVD